MNTGLAAAARPLPLPKAGAPADVAGAIQAALDSPETSRRMAAEGQVAVLKRYSVARLLRDMAVLYRELLARRASPNS